MFSPADRIKLPQREHDGGGGWLHLFAYGIVAPLTVVACLAAAWYIVTGETPLDIAEEMMGSPRVALPMPPSIGPERSTAALLRPPPPANDPDVKMSMAPIPVPAPPAPPAPAEAKAAEDPKPAEVKPPEPPAAPPPPAIAKTAEPVVAAKPAPAAPVAVVTSPPSPPPMSEPAVPPGGEPLAPPTFAQLPARTDIKPLGPAPLPELLKVSAAGALPIAVGGREPRTVYGRPFAGDASLPHVAFVVVGLGLSKDATEAAIAKLPPEVSLSFSPYAGNLDTWVKRARAAGHEVLLDLPLEPPNFPMRDAGPLAVLAHQSPAEAQSQLLTILGKTTSYVGVAGALHSPVPASEQWVPLLRTIRNRGLLFVGDGLVGVAEQDAPASASVTLVADETPFRAAIDARFLRLQATAQRDGSAVAYLSPRPVTFERVLAFIGAFPQKGLVLTPVSALVRAPS